MIKESLLSEKSISSEIRHFIATSCLKNQISPLKNGGKTLKIITESLYYWIVKRELEVTINNPRRVPGTSNFNLHWEDEISKLQGWVTVSDGVGNAHAQRIEFNQENFFKMITVFA